MNRIIKFRFWNTELKMMFCKKNNELYGYLKGNFPGDREEFEKLIFMQFTGLLDKNGKEIYEGDILKRFTEVNESFGFDLVKVQWNNDRCYWELERGNNQASYWGHISGSHAREGRYEVIGNIYENPELIK